MLMRPADSLASLIHDNQPVTSAPLPSRNRPRLSHSAAHQINAPAGSSQQMQRPHRVKALQPASPQHQQQQQQQQQQLQQQPQQLAPLVSNALAEADTPATGYNAPQSLQLAMQQSSMSSPHAHKVGYPRPAGCAACHTYTSKAKPPCSSLGPST